MNVAVEKDTVEEAINYLEILDVILRRLDSEGRGREGSDPLLEKLQALPFLEPEVGPLRYQTEDGGGWRYLADNAAATRAALLEVWARGAL